MSTLPGSSAASEIGELIASEVASRLQPLVHEEVGREEERRYRQIKWFIAFVGIVGLGTFGTLANYLIEKAVESRLEAKAGNISESMEFMRFYTITLKLDLGTSYSSEEKDAVMTYLRSAAKLDRIRHSKEFLAGLTRVAEAFAASSQASALDEIFAMYEREVLASPTLVESFLHHYGQDIVARAAAPKSDQSFSTFEKLERAAVSNSEELALYYRTLYTYRKYDKKPHVELDALLSRAMDLKKEDLQRYLGEIFQRSSVENWQRSPTPEGRLIEHLIRSLLRDYAPMLNKRLKTPPELLERIAGNGLEEDKVKPLAAIVASGAKK